jgi:hypothetical protein
MGKLEHQKPPSKDKIIYKYIERTIGITKGCDLCQCFHAYYSFGIF